MGIMEDPRGRIKSTSREKSKKRKSEIFQVNRENLGMKRVREGQPGLTDSIMNMKVKQIKEAVTLLWKSFMNTHKVNDERNKFMLQEVDDSLYHWKPADTRFVKLKADNFFKMNVGLTLMIHMLMKKLPSKFEPTEKLAELRIKKVNDEAKAQLDSYKKNWRNSDQLLPSLL
jgi:hypothetical protein